MKNFIINEGYPGRKSLFEGGIGSKIIFKKKYFLDLSCCSGALLLGHNSKIFKKSIKEVTQKNISPLSTPNMFAKNYVNVLKKIIPHKEKFIFCNSGTEAVIKALRIGFAVSKKNIVLAATGSWHGSVDNLLFSPGKKLKPIPISEGLLNTHKKNIKFIPYNDIEKSKDIILRYRKKASCIIVEPIQGSLPTADAKKYLKFLRKISKKYRILLIFDEIITGLRTDASTLQSYFGIHPDISTFGKCFGGGLPIGIIGVTKGVYKSMKKKEKNIFFGGTFSANSITTYVGMKTTNYILKNKKKIFSKLEKNSNYFQEQMNLFFQKENIQAKIFRFKSLLRIVYTDKKVINRIQRDFLETNKLGKVALIRNFLHKKKIYYPGNGLIFFSDQISRPQINYLIHNLQLAFKQYY